MYKYFVIACVAAAFVFLGDMGEKRFKSAGAKRACVIGAYAATALMLCLVAGLRADQVGTDVNFYAIPAFDLAQQRDFVDFWTKTEYARWMPLAKLIFWVVPNCTHSVFFLLFVIHVVIVIPMLVALRLILKDNAWLGVLVFGLAFLPISFNLMRQFMGLSFVLLAYYFVQKRKPIWFVLFVVIGALFHESSLAGLLVYLLYLLSSGSLKKVCFDPGLVGLITFVAIQLFFPLVYKIAPLLGRFSSFINGRIAEQYGGGGSRELCFMIIICLVLGILYRVFTQKDKPKAPLAGEVSGLASIVFFGVGVFSMCLYSFQLFRAGVCFLYFAVLLIPLAYESIKQRGRRLEFAAIAICLLALFGHVYYGAGSHAVVPYVLDLAGRF